MCSYCGSQWPRGLRRNSTAVRLLGFWVPIAPWAWMSVLNVVIRLRFLRRTDHSSRGVLPTVVRRCVWARNHKNEEAMALVGSQRHRKKMYSHYYVYVFLLLCTICSIYSVFIVPTGTLRLTWLKIFRGFSSDLTLWPWNWTLK